MLIEFLYFLLLTEKLVLFLLKNFLFIDDFFVYFLIVRFWSLKLLFVHVSVSFELFNETFVFGRAFLFLIDLSLELHETHVDGLFKFLYLLFLESESSNFLLNGLWYFLEILLFFNLSCNLFSECRKLFEFILCELFHGLIYFLNLCKLFVFNSFLFFQLFECFFLFLYCQLHFIQLWVKLFVFKVEIFSQIFINRLLRFGIIKLQLNNFQFLFFLFFILLFWFHFYFLLGFSFE